MGRSDEAEILNTGWIGRYFDHEYQAYTSAPSDSPVGLQIGNQASLIFGGPGNTFGLAVTNPTQFYQIAQSGQLYATDNLPDCAYGEELQFMRQTTNSTVRYAEAIHEAYNAATNESGYSDTYLSEQLAIVARLIKGNLNTRVFLCRPVATTPTAIKPNTTPT